YILSAAFVLGAVACTEKEDGPAESKMKGIFHVEVISADEIQEIMPGKNKTLLLKACADFETGVSDLALKMTMKADLDAVAVYNEMNETNYESMPAGSYEFLSDEVTMPRYGTASSTAKLKISTTGMEDGVTYLLPVAIDKVDGTDNWGLTEYHQAFIPVKMAYVAPDAGLGTKESPYNLYSVDDIMAMNEKLEDGVKVYFRLKKDIDMEGVDWFPLNSADPYAKLVDFDGGGHTISNFTCNAPAYSSFFGVLYGSVYDLNFENASVTAETKSACGIVGGYCGTTGKPGTCRNVHVSGTVTSIAGVNGVGGLFGRLNEGTVEKCSADCAVTSNANYAGGLFGYDAGVSHVSDCYTSGSVDGNQRIGGICGGLIKATSSVIRCYSTSSVICAYAIGGIAGHCNLDQKSGTPEESNPENVFEKCIAWNSSIKSRNFAEGTNDHYSGGAIIGFTSIKNYLIDCVRKADLDFTDYTDINVPYDQENAGPSSLLAIAVSGPYNYPYHGKAAAAGATLSSVAKGLGWPADIWDFSGDIPVHKSGASGPIDEKPDVDAGGQLPDFEENELYK
ncbi:MAG: DUF1735 domain-containing protein, partial [Bacteroidales bacterium]|nr:DUF1735 domain-containing protein [Bacteroidales bacterium]